jgi:hypothetical protein
MRRHHGPPRRVLQLLELRRDERLRIGVRRRRARRRRIDSRPRRLRPPGPVSLR